MLFAGNNNSTVIGFLLALLVPIALFATLGILLWRRAVRVRNMPQNPLTRETSVDLDVEFSQAIEMVVESMKILKAEVRSVGEPQEGVVFGKTRFTWRTFGQYLQVNVQTATRGRQHLVCRTWPAVDTVVWDWGAGNQILRDFLDQLVRHRSDGVMVAEE